MWHVDVEVEVGVSGVVVGFVLDGADVLGLSEVVESLQPNQPGVLQVWDDVGVVVVFVLVVWLRVSLVVVSSRQPHHPGVLHVLVWAVVVVVVVVVVIGVVSLFVFVLVLWLPFSLVVVSSRHPHHPGVLHVLVRVVVVIVVVLLVLVVKSEWLLSKYSQLKQSVQLTICLHSAGSSYLSSTSLITTLIR